MYITSKYKNKDEENFDWNSYFFKKTDKEILENVDIKKKFFNIRGILKENKFQMAFALKKVITKLLENFELNNPRILELGAATGFLTRLLISQYDGSGVLVDNNYSSYKAFKSIRGEFSQPITYLKENIFALKFIEKFDVVCSFGLIEHFKNKKEIIKIHKKFVKSNGLVIILVPMDSPLSRVFYEVNLELNLGYRELLNEREFNEILIQNDLKVVRTGRSWGYVYDFIGAICRSK